MTDSSWSDALTEDSSMAVESQPGGTVSVHGSGTQTDRSRVNVTMVSRGTQTDEVGEFVACKRALPAPIDERCTKFRAVM